jgi:leader peptidase (prepilin peptidase)/N-methyltransferase
MPAPEWLAPGTWQMGLATALAGAVIGSGLMRLLRFVFSWGFGKEALGLGDADLMMMIGAFLGWQAIVPVLGLAVFLGLFVALLQFLLKKGREIAFGPYLAGGAVLTLLGTGIPEFTGVAQMFFFDLPLMVILLGLAGLLSFFMTLSIRMLRLVLQAV